MRTHGNSPLGIEGRRRLVDLVLGGLSLREAAARRGVSVATAHRWITRWNSGKRCATEHARVPFGSLQPATT